MGLGAGVKVGCTHSNPLPGRMVEEDVAAIFLLWP